MVCWVEPSAQNSIFNSNNSSHKKPAELNSYLLWPTWNLHTQSWNLRTQTRRLWGLSDQTILWVTWVVFIPYPFAPNGHLLPHSLRLELKLSLSHPSLVLPTLLLKSFWFLEGFGSRECEKAREDHSPPFLCTWWSPNRLVCSLLLELGS